MCQRLIYIICMFLLTACTTTTPTNISTIPSTPVVGATDTPISPTPTAVTTDTPVISVTITAQDVISKFNDAGLNVSNVAAREREPDSPLPNSYKENFIFSVPEVAPKGGQVFICDTKRNCDALYAYFDALIALAGPYLYQSPNGLVVAQLNSGLTPETAAKFEQVISSLR